MREERERREKVEQRKREPEKTRGKVKEQRGQERKRRKNREIENKWRERVFQTISPQLTPHIGVPFNGPSP